MAASQHRIDYVEFPATDLARVRSFYERIFNWKFTGYGPDYESFEDGRIAGGFCRTDTAGAARPLVVIYAEDLAEMQDRIRAAGGAVVRETFSFPGGRRFHFTDPSGNELSVWSDR